MIKPETQIEISRVTAGLFFWMTLIGVLVAISADFLTPNVYKPEPTNGIRIPFVLVAFMLLYGSYYFTLAKKLYKIHIAVWVIFVTLCIMSTLQPIVAIVLVFLLSQSVLGIIRLYYNSRRKSEAGGQSNLVLSIAMGDDDAA